MTERISPRNACEGRERALRYALTACLAMVAVAGASACSDQVILSRSAGGSAMYCSDPCPAGTPGACGFVPDCGCPCGETCRLVDVETPGCETAGLGVEGDACNSLNDCGPSLHCSRVSILAMGVCTPFCRNSLSCDSGSCARIGAEASPWSRDVGFCTSACEPLSFSGCAASFYCSIGAPPSIEGPRVYAALCHPTGPLQAGDPCSPGQCDAGLTCDPLGASPGLYCQASCRSTGECPDGRCVSRPSGMSVVGNDFGSCAPTCDPLDPTACPAPLGCYFDTSPTVEGTTEGSRKCWSSGTGTQGSACSGPEECAAGFDCDGMACRRYCGSQDDCGGEACYLLEPGLGMCADGCDTGTGAGCEAPLVCLPASGTVVDGRTVSSTICVSR